jgi:hypothetical protein
MTEQAKVTRVNDVEFTQDQANSLPLVDLIPNAFQR